MPATDVDGVIANFVALLSKAVRVEAIILYGSYARGTADEWSDIDIAVISPDFEDLPLWERQRIISRATIDRAASLAPIGYPTSEYQNPGRHSFLREIIRTGKVVYWDAES
ncbi:MAG: nucleotidyltransferase domain-containing protein [Dehalococcoidia bacterium]|nr:nucleotidyltransferase domain-containing protein [Dehalococcoidia bacterium]